MSRNPDLVENCFKLWMCSKKEFRRLAAQMLVVFADLDCGGGCTVDCIRLCLRICDARGDS